LNFFPVDGILLFKNKWIRKKTQPLPLVWLDQRFPNFFEPVPNLSLVNTSRPKPQTTYEKNDCMDEFWQKVAKFVFNVSNLLFSQVPTL